jgi:hypothetical protein
MMPPPEKRLTNDRPLIWDALYDENPDDKNPGKALDTNCDDGQNTWSYTQGVILGALVELYRATGDTTLLDEADRIANAALDSTRQGLLDRMVYPQGSPHQDVLREHCEEYCLCGLIAKPFCHVINPTNDAAVTFKDVFVRNLRELYDQNNALGRSTYTWASFLKKQRESLIANARTETADFGFFWTGPITKVDFATTASAIDAFNAALGL